MNQQLLPEVLEVVFIYLNGKSLARSEQVCKLWKDCIQNLTKNTDIWKKCCETEMGRDVRIEILNICYPFWHESELVNAEWKTVYRKWCLWQQFGKWPFIVRTFSHVLIPKVTCVKISGTYIVTGHVDGAVFMWSNNESIEEPLVTVHRSNVTDLGLIVGNRIIDQEKMKHKYVVSTSNDRTIHISRLNCEYVENKENSNSIILREHNTATLSVRVNADMFAVLSQDETISIWQLQFSQYCVGPNIIMCHKIRLFANRVCAICIYGTQVIQVSAITHTGVLIPVYLRDAEKSFKLLSQDISNFSTLKEWKEIDGRIMDVFLFRFGISIILTDKHYMYVSLCGQRQVKYNTMPHLYSYPVTVLLYGDILLLGMESGNLYLYNTKDVNDLLTLDLQAYTWKYVLCSEPVIGLDIADSDDAPRIVAVTENEIFFITFLPPWLR